MARTVIHQSLRVRNWQTKFRYEYMRKTRFARWMGDDENKIFQEVMDLSKKRGHFITVNLVMQLPEDTAWVMDDDTLQGNEVEIDAFGDEIQIHQYRQAVSQADYEGAAGPFELLEAGRTLLMQYSRDQLKRDFIGRMGSANVDGFTHFDDCTEDERDAHLTANADRYLFGAARGNQVAGDMSASLLTVDATTDIMSPAGVSLVKRLAQDASPNITPIRVNDDEEWFVLFAQKWAFRDLKNHPTMIQNLQLAEMRGKDNPLWTGGSLMHDGVIIVEIPEIPTLDALDPTALGAAGISVAMNYLCGAQNVAVAWAKFTQAIQDTDDYDNVTGVGVREWKGIQKLHFENDVQHGQVSWVTASVADA